MRIIGIRRGHGSGVEVTSLTESDGEATVIATLEAFWADPARYLSGPVEGHSLDLTSVERVPPVPPDAHVFCVGLNYLEHAAEGSYRDQELPAHPTIFARWTKSLSVDGAAVRVPSSEEGLDWEGEVVAWVGMPLVEASPEEALEAVVGYSTFNDLSARRAQKLTSQWTLGKNGARSGPLGPMIPAAEVGDLRHGLRLRTRVNGETMQDARTDQMIHTVGDTLAFISHTVPLCPGDLLATGTPAGVGYARTPPRLLQPGDTVEVEVDRLGVLRTHVIDRG